MNERDRHLRRPYCNIANRARSSLSRHSRRYRDEAFGANGSCQCLLTACSPVLDPDDIDEVPANEAEKADEQIVDQATAVATLAEPEAEILVLTDFEECALRLKLSGQDAKWCELGSILDEPLMLDSATGLRRKVIIFTESNAAAIANKQPGVSG
jgi:hypothetical protein